MKAKELRDFGDKELIEKLSGMEEELFNLRFQGKIGQLSNPVRMRMVRKDIARIHTILNEKKQSSAQSLNG
ncbi:MAG: 50S ribosomal protein L29 [Chitinivibrionales bacterium]|nr:50S ribosomal protein L29 [Chitinivibrionales bacterium]